MISSYRKTQKLILSNSTPKGQAPFIASTSTLIASTSTLLPLKDRAAYQTYINTQRLMLYDRMAYVMGDKLKNEYLLSTG